VPINEDIPHNEHDRKIKMLKYYQWTPFILLFQALLFYLPRMVWRSLNDKSGLDIQSLVDAVYSYTNDAAKYTDREILMNYLTNLFHQYVNSVKELKQNQNHPSKMEQKQHYLVASNQAIRRRNVQSKDDKSIVYEAEDAAYSSENDDSDNEQRFYQDDQENFNTKPQSKFWQNFARFSKILCITKGKRYGNYLLALFVFVKLMYTINSFMQLFILNHFLGNDFLVLGIEVLNKIWNGDDWTQLKRFPRVTMCDFRIREVGIVHRYTVSHLRLSIGMTINLFSR
jgi:hypothetical protein